MPRKNYCFIYNVNVLILHQHFNTPDKGGALRSYYLAIALKQAGHHPVVITAGDVARTTVRIYEGIEIHYLPVSYNNRFGFWRRSISFLRFVTGAIRVSKALPGIQLCYAMSVPLTVGLAARRIKQKMGIPYIFEVGDLWPEAPIQLGFIKNSLFKWCLFRLEMWIYRGAEAVVALSPMIKADIERRSKGTSVLVIPNMSDVQYYRPMGKNVELENQYGLRGKFVVSYVGAVGFANGLDFLIDCARATRRAGMPVHYLLCGDGAMLDHLKAVAARHDLGNVTIMPYQSREGVQRVLSVSDAALICYRPVPILETGSPNKYFDGLAAGKLILINFSGWIREEIETEQCGLFISPANPASITTLIEPFLASRDRLISFQSRSRSVAERKYSREQLGAAFVKLVEAHALSK